MSVGEGNVGKNGTVPLWLASSNRLWGAGASVCLSLSCQRRTGAVVHSGCAYSKDRVRIEGDNKIYERDADSGFKIRFHFCPNCGSNVFWEGDKDPNIYGITVGSFADPNFPPPTFSVWEEMMHPWLGVASVAEHYAQGWPLTR